MGTEPTLFDRPSARRKARDRETIDERFWAFHEANPDVFAHLCTFAQGAVEAGFERYSIKALVERVRYHVEVEVRSTDGFRINNDFSSRYARLLMDEGVVPAGFFETRTLRTD